MGKYFTNTELDNLWTRLVSATKSIVGNLSNDGVKEIHDALINHFGLTHNNTPKTPGDYIRGIAEAARYCKYGYEPGDDSVKNGLEEIVEMLEQYSPNVCEYCDSCESCDTCEACDGCMSCDNGCDVCDNCDICDNDDTSCTTCDGCEVDDTCWTALGGCEACDQGT